MAYTSKELLRSTRIPVFYVAILWTIQLYVQLFQLDLVQWGIYPRRLIGLWGILFSPFIHGDWSHLYNNSLPLVVLGTALFTFFRHRAIQAWMLIHLLSGIWTWTIGGAGWHIGASSLVYGLAFFHFWYGVFSKKKSLMAFSLTVVFLYGSIIWGVLPGQTGVSWEGHLGGAFVGSALGYYYKLRNQSVNESEPIPDYSAYSKTNKQHFTYTYLQSKDSIE